MLRTLLKQSCKGRSYSTSHGDLDKWIASPKQIVLSDSFTSERLSDLYITLPTRDGTRVSYQEPAPSSPLGYGHHLAFFHSRLPESQLREDGTEGDFCPPAPFTRRMWAGGKITWNNENPLIIGGKANATCSISAVEKKGFEAAGRDPKVFVNQRIEIAMAGKAGPSVVEDRSHVYIVPSKSGTRVNTPREVRDIPTSYDFSFKYTPSLITLFRFSALMFNAHYIHLDQEYSQKKQGYPERLVHGPLTAMMLLEVAVLHNPALKIKSFEYRARNPVIINQATTIHGAWKDAKNVVLWCSDDNGVVGMTGIASIE